MSTIQPHVLCLETTATAADFDTRRATGRRELERRQEQMRGGGRSGGCEEGLYVATVRLSCPRARHVASIRGRRTRPPLSRSKLTVFYCPTTDRYDYYDDGFGFCKPKPEPQQQSESLGSALFGDRLWDSPFQVSSFALHLWRLAVTDYDHVY